MSGTTPAERIRLAIGDKPKGFKGPKREPLYVELCPLDIIELCEGLEMPTDISEAQLKAAQYTKAHPTITILVDDAYHLVEQAEKAVE
jgi:hypothetical protein